MGEEWEQSKPTATGPELLTKIQPVFLIKHFSDCCKPMVNFQSSKQSILTIFASFLIALMKENFWGFLPHHFCWHGYSHINRITHYVVYVLLLSLSMLLWGFIHVVLGINTLFHLWPNRLYGWSIHCMDGPVQKC